MAHARCDLIAIHTFAHTPNHFDSGTALCTWVWVSDHWQRLVVSCNLYHSVPSSHAKFRVNRVLAEPPPFMARRHRSHRIENRGVAEMECVANLIMTIAMCTLWCINCCNIDRSSHRRKRFLEGAMTAMESRTSRASRN